jgi:hypothetical protein
VSGGYKQATPTGFGPAAASARTARNRRTRTRMYGGVGAGRGNPPGDPIRPQLRCANRLMHSMKFGANCSSSLSSCLCQ